MPLAGQDVRPKDVRETAKGGSAAMPKLQELLKNPDRAVRLEAVKQITEIGTAREPRSADRWPPRITIRKSQIMATDGLVNFYLPGYVKTGIGASLRRVGGSIKGKFTDTNDQVIDAFVEVRPEVIEGLGKLARGGGNMDARANAARALGILRGKAAVPDLVEAARSKNTRPHLRISCGATEDPRSIGRAAHQLPAARPRSQGADRGR